MRMRKSQQKKYNLRRRTLSKDPEGGDIVTYEAAVEIEATIWQASGQVQAQMYGERLAYIKNMEYEQLETMQEGDGICVDVAGEADPDYKIISINKDHSPKRMVLERI